MIGYVLAAGLGTRLRPLSDHTPKALVPVCGKLVLERQLEAFVRAGVTSLGVNSHYLHDQIEEFARASSIAFQLFHEKDAIRGTGGALHFARSFLTQDETCCVRNVDIVAPFDILGLHRIFVDSGAEAGLVAVPVAAGGSVVYDPVTLAYRGTVKDAAEGGRAEFIGAAFYRRSFFDLVTEDDFSVVPIWKRALDAGRAVRVLPVPSLYWRDIGTPTSLAQIHFDALDGSLLIDTPLSIRLDMKSRCAVPAQWNFACPSGIGPNAWIEEPSFPRDCAASQCVVLRGSVVEPHAKVHRAFFTPFGRISLDA